MKIYIITPIYASTTKGDGATPLVHYFAREWVRMGHDVTVFNFMARFPRPYYWVGKMFQHQFNSRLGMLVPTHCPRDEDFVIEGVKVIRKTLTKYKPHTEYTHDKTEKALDVVRNECMKFGIPDYFIGHWDSPCMEILPRLKQEFHKPIVLVLHSNQFSFEKRYGNKAKDALKQFDVLGFRNRAALQDFESKYFKPARSFICYSGVSQAFLKAGERITKTFEEPIKNYIYTGSLIARKYSDNEEQQKIESQKSLYDSLIKKIENHIFNSINISFKGEEKQKVLAYYKTFYQKLALRNKDKKAYNSCLWLCYCGDMLEV